SFMQSLKILRQPTVKLLWVKGQFTIFLIGNGEKMANPPLEPIAARLAAPSQLFVMRHGMLNGICHAMAALSHEQA
ncbi:MAG: hypothetical protein V1766_15155, partial [Pseudomonadota bacterium]